MIVPPVAFAFFHNTPAERAEAIKRAIQATRNTNKVLPYANLLSDMLISIAKGEATVRQAAQKAGLALNMDVAQQVER